MSYKTPPGMQRIFTYLPKQDIIPLRLLAVANQRTLAAEMQRAVLEYLAREERNIPRVKEASHD